MKLRIGARVVLLAVATLGPGQATTSAEPRQAEPQLLKLVDDYYEQLLVLNPVLATYNGDHRFNDRFSIGIAPEHRRKSQALERRYLKRVQSIAPESLSESGRLTRELFIHGRRQALDGQAFPDHLLPVDQLHSVPVIFAMLGAGGSIQPFATVEDYEHWLSRLEHWSDWVDQAIVNMREGLERGIVQPRVLMERALPLLEAHIVDAPQDSVFWRPVTTMPPMFATADRDRLRASYRAAIREHVVPPYRRLYEFIRDVYLPRTRDSVGMSELPGGADWYRFLVRAQTSTTLTPEEIHRIGLSEVARLEREIERAASRSSRGGEPSMTAHGPLLEGYRSLRQRVGARLPELFERIPKADFEIRPVERFRSGSAAGASYVAGTPDGSRLGVFYVNARETARGTPSEALFLHEASPGHHFQISLQRELGELPRFRRFGHYTAYSEGWALYVEGLGEALGLYQDRDQYVRALRSELFRARRLVVDTGLHALGWSRERAIRYIGSTTEVDRYIAIPGQALAYKVGQLRIRQLRQRAEQKLGERFDIRKFHHAILGNGAMPLDVLESRIDAWIHANAETKGVAAR